jgi:formylglycine-generating enzyme required for sulfatase activity
VTHPGRYALVNGLALGLTGLLVQCGGGGGATPIVVPAPSQPAAPAPTSVAVNQANGPALVRNASGPWEATVRVGNASIAMVQVPAGRFRMGTDATDNPDLDHARPVHDVTISRDFWMGKVPVTQAQWQAVMGGNPSSITDAGPDAPVDKVSWDDCQRFLARLDGLQGQWTFRLPTEAEWEYACRAGTDGEAYGSLDAIAWYSGNSAGTIHPVGQKQPNAFGLYDMLGNVWQWCQDWYADTYPGGGPVTDPQGPSHGFYRVFRGGSWSVSATFVRSAYRDFFTPPDSRMGGMGFRVVAVARTP